MSVSSSRSGGDFWEIDTTNGKVYVWKPTNYSGSSPIIYVKGYHVTAKQALENYRLLDQFRVSRVPAIYIIPEAPSSSDQPVFVTDLNKLLTTVSAETGIALSGPVTALGHSGAYRTLAKWLNNPNLKHITLIDALYGNVQDFTRWADQAGNKLISIAATASPTANTKTIEGKPGVQTIYMPSVSHMSFVTTGKYIPEFLQKAAKGNLLLIAIVAAFATALYFLR